MRKQKQREINTDHLSTERIWVEKEVDSFWFNHNEQVKDNSISATQEFLTGVDTKAKSAGFVDVVVRPCQQDSDEYNLEKYYIQVTGYRLETDKEYVSRLQGLLGQLKREEETFNRRKDYYRSEDFTKRCKTFEDQITAVNKK